MSVTTARLPKFHIDQEHVGHGKMAEREFLMVFCEEEIDGDIEIGKPTHIGAPVTYSFLYERMPGGRVHLEPRRQYLDQLCLTFTESCQIWAQHLSIVKRALRSSRVSPALI
ncbi:uncharacterized protein RCC_09520 [Ramularia collo-cygni]|uniref:Uncharacterized protein n=1 Tax=Ramularia collo-cygni TaxID=112498 RepID=A0A2D3V362_9PEZI|nr:uncharacterized protein RCC_09520 [Ramularia collo-cygni]CZT23806.1 uncharacterized protein RCC_09520 [Ramularia collo-cygni]